MKCNSLTATGSEFYLMPGNIAVKSSTGINCSSQFDTDSLAIELNTFLAPGNYSLHIKKGTDGNTVLDYCDREIAETDKLDFTVLPKAPVPMDSMAALACKPNQLKLIFKKPVLCSSIAADGSDFTVNGTYPVGVTAAAGACNSGTTKEILVTLSTTLQKAGSFQLLLQRGSDGNTLMDECGEETGVGSSLSFSVKDTVNANFSYQIGYGCEKDTLYFFHDGANGVTTWRWQLDEGQTSQQQNPTGIYSVFNQKNIRLYVSNGFCADSSAQSVLLDNFIKADFNVFEDNCPKEPIQFTSTAEGRVVAHLWEFGDGSTASEKDPVYAYPGPDRETAYPVRYTVFDSLGCRKTAVKNITVFNSCYLAVPTAFTPNGDGKNDLFRVMNAIKAEDLEMIVFNRWGQVVFRTRDWKKGWDGRIKGELQPTGVYVWLLRYTARDTKKKVEQKGTVTLVR
jgi:gliding motility-associated-like protein